MGLLHTASAPLNTITTTALTPTIHAKLHPEESCMAYRDTTEHELIKLRWATKGSIWMPFGDLILVAGDKFFQFERRILLRHSAIFRDVLYAPRPADAIEHFGCPVMNTAADAEYFLTALLDLDGHVSYRLPLRPFFLMVSAMLRLGTDYQVEPLRQDAIRRLEEIFPPRLDYFRNSYTVSDGAQADSVVFYSYSMQDIWPAHAITALYLAQIYGIPHILPQVYYICAQLTHEILVDGFRDQDGIQWMLSRDDLRRCLLGERALLEQNLEQEKFVLEPTSVSPGCKDPRGCKLALGEIGREHCQSVSHDAAALLDDGWIRNMDICKPCKIHFVKRYNSGRRKIWKQLPQYFELG